MASVLPSPKFQFHAVMLPGAMPAVSAKATHSGTQPVCWSDAMVGTGNGRIVTVCIPVTDAPQRSVTVTVYVVVAAGVACGDWIDALSSPVAGDHE